jgi:hypothetical protein
MRRVQMLQTLMVLFLIGMRIQVDHVIGEFDNLAVNDTYHGNDQIYTTSGSSMHIQHIGTSIIRSPCRDLELNNAIHVPQSSKYLASAHCIAFDNNILFELHHEFFLSRIESRGKPFIKGGLREAFTLFHAAPPHPLPNIFFIPTRLQVLDDMLAWATPLHLLFVLFLARIIFLALVILLQK